MKQELPTLPEHMSSSTVISGVHVAQSFVFYIVFCRSLFVLSSFLLLAIVLSVLFQWILITYMVSPNSSYPPIVIYKFVLKSAVISACQRGLVCHCPPFYCVGGSCFFHVTSIFYANLSPTQFPYHISSRCSLFSSWFSWNKMYSGVK